MEINPLQRRIDASAIAPEKLAGNSSLSQDQKVAEASRQFEAVLLRQILSDSQKTVIPSELSDNSTAAGIYQDVITNTLADNISKSGAFGLAKTFTQQLNHPGHTPAKAAGATAVRSGHPLSADNLSVSSLRRTTTTPVKQP
jgi:Rod binding domain-containing protein